MVKGKEKIINFIRFYKYIYIVFNTDMVVKGQRSCIPLQPAFFLFRRCHPTQSKDYAKDSEVCRHGCAERLLPGYR